MSTRFDASGDGLARTTNLPPIGSFTLLGWFRMAATTGSYTGFLALGAASGDQQYEVMTDADGLTLALWNGAGTFPTGAKVPVGQWFHLALTVAGTGAGLFLCYLNGRLAVTSDGVGTLSASKLFITNDPSSEWYNGDVANIEVYSRALSVSEIRARMASPYPPRDRALNAVYPLNGTQRIRDASGNNYHLTVAGTLTEGGKPNFQELLRRVFLLSSGGGATVALVANAIARSQAGSALPITRALTSTGRSRSQAGSVLPIGRSVVPTAIARSRAPTAPTTIRTLVGSAQSRSQVVSVLPVTRSLVGSARSASQAGSALPVARVLISTARSTSWGSAVPGAAGIVLLIAMAIARSQASSALPVTRSLVGSAVSRSRAGSALPISRALSAMAQTRTMATAAAVRLVVLAASARSLGMTAAALPILRRLAATSVALSRSSAAISLALPVSRYVHLRLAARPAYRLGARPAYRLAKRPAYEVEETEE